MPFDAHDEQVEAELGRQQPTHPMPGLLIGPDPVFTQPITCSCANVQTAFPHPLTVVPCVETAGPSGLCPACEVGACSKPIEATEAA